MNPAYPQWPGFPSPFAAGRRRPVAPTPPPGAEIPDHHSQLEELLGHVRRCEVWARIDDRIDLRWRLEGNA
jgi:hypothetical protein